MQVSLPQPAGGHRNAGARHNHHCFRSRAASVCGRRWLVFLVFVFAMFAGPAAAVDPVKHPPRPQPWHAPGAWESIVYPTPLRDFFFGAHRFRADPRWRWEPGRWVPVGQEERE